MVIPFRLAVGSRALLTARERNDACLVAGGHDFGVANDCERCGLHRDIVRAIVDANEADGPPTTRYPDLGGDAA